MTVGAVDLARSEQFYVTLGLHLIVKDSHYLRFECPEGGSTFSVELVAAVSPEEQVTIYFETEDLDDLYDRLIAVGVSFDQAPQDMSWLWREARLADPWTQNLPFSRRREPAVPSVANLITGVGMAGRRRNTAWSRWCSHRHPDQLPHAARRLPTQAPSRWRSSTPDGVPPPEVTTAVTASAT